MKRTKKDVLMKAASDLFGDKTIMVKKNFVEFGAPADIWKKIREWLDKGDGDRLTIGTTAPEKLKLIIINEREQQAYAARGYKDN